jgi:hypothetical protein
LRPIVCLLAVMTIVLLAGCGSQRMVRATAIAFAPKVVGCSGPLSRCTSGNAAMLQESREASIHLCPADKPDVLIESDGTLVCVAALPPVGPSSIGVATPIAVRARGPGAIADFRAGQAMVATTGCLACHRISGAGNKGPGPELTHVGARLAPAAIARVLVHPRAPMPSFSGLPGSKRRALVYFLAQLR